MANEMEVILDAVAKALENPGKMILIDNEEGALRLMWTPKQGVALPKEVQS